MSRAISFTTLPPKEGYVEIETDEGERIYEPLPEQIEKENQKKSYEDLVSENKLLKAQLQAQTDRSDFIEDCIAEMATVVYNA
jgi:hypothetical protein